MFAELESLSLSIQSVTEGPAKQVVDAVNRRLAHLLGASLVRVYWREEADRGAVILKPFTFINKTSEDEPKQFELHDEPNGVLSWCYHNKEPLWLEELKSKSAASDGIVNEATGGRIPPEYSRVTYSSDSLMVTPLIHTGDIRGLYVVDLPVSGRLKPSVIQLLQQLGRSLALILAKTEEHETNLRNTSKAVQRFLDSINTFEFDHRILGENIPTGFIARPFDPEFARVEGAIETLLEKRGFAGSHYRPQEGGAIVIEEIISQIGEADFCIADVTGGNSNVLAEVGMMMMQKKRFVLIRRKGDDTSRPFNLSAYYLYDYEFNEPGGELRLYDVSTQKSQSFDIVLDTLVGALAQES